VLGGVGMRIMMVVVVMMMMMMMRLNPGCPPLADKLTPGGWPLGGVHRVPPLVAGGDSEHPGGGVVVACHAHPNDAGGGRGHAAQLGKR
jgi:hypothetical protein